MSCLCWNVQGMGNPKTITALRKVLFRVTPSLVFLFETRLAGNRASDVCIKVGFDHCFVVDSVGKSGGLILLWPDDWDVVLLSFSSGHVDAWVIGPDGLSWRFTGFYGNPSAAKRRFSWNLIRKLYGVRLGPWLIGGDFNEVLSYSKKVGDHDKLESAILNF